MEPLFTKTTGRNYLTKQLHPLFDRNLSFFAIDAYWIGHSDYNWLGFLIHVEAKYVRPRIVPHDIKIVFSTCDISQVQVRRQNTFTREVGTSEQLSKGIDSTTATTRKDVLWFITKWCDVGGWVEGNVVNLLYC